MYESVIRPRATSIMHAMEKNNPHVSRAFRAMPVEKSLSLNQGEMAVPVQIDSHDIVSDPTLSNYETPLILPTTGTMPSALVRGRSQSLVNVSKKDAQRLKQKVAAKNSLNAKLAACTTY
jgi:hypothetical protein